MRTVGQQEPSEVRQLGTIIETRTNDSGSIIVEEEAKERKLWKLERVEQEGDEAADAYMDINVTRLHLPLFASLLHTHNRSNVTTGDFLLIGAGKIH